MLRIGSIVLRVDDQRRRAEFWEAALGYVRREGDSDDFVLLRPPDGAGPNLSLDRVRSTLQIPPRIHLEPAHDDSGGGADAVGADGRGATDAGAADRPEPDRLRRVDRE